MSVTPNKPECLPCVTLSLSRACAGFEWGILQSEIIDGGSRPTQLLFELHTQRANPYFVPPNVVEGKDRASVNRLFLALHNIGYRVVSKEINGGDRACAEFALALVA